MIPPPVTAIFAAAALSLIQEGQPLKLVDKVDLSRYAGTWYEVAHFANEFQRDCVGDVIATYTLRPDGDITVVNKCRKADGTLNDAEGVARLAGEEKNNAALEVRFAPAILSILSVEDVCAQFEEKLRRAVCEGFGSLRDVDGVELRAEAGCSSPDKACYSGFETAAMKPATWRSISSCGRS